MTFMSWNFTLFIVMFDHDVKVVTGIKVNLIETCSVGSKNSWIVLIQIW